jgi:phosphonate transport system substrate-binding protein
MLALACGVPAERTTVVPTQLRVAVLPDESESRLRALYDPLVHYLATATGLRIELYVPEDYDALLDAFDDDELDLVWFGGLTFSEALQRSNAHPLVSRDIDARFTTLFLAAADADGDSVEDFKDKPFAFGPRLSTSGHLMARAFLEEHGIQAEVFFENVKYSSGHDETIHWIHDGTVAIGSVNAQILQTMLHERRLDSTKLRVVATSPPYQNYVWATRETLDPGVRQALMDAFLALDPAVPEHASILANFGAGGFVPIGSDSYTVLSSLAIKLGLLDIGQ